MNCLINLDVDDLEEAVRFYSSVFGLKVGRSFGAFGVEMLGSSAPIYLLVKAPGTLASPTTSQRRSYERHWTPVHLDFVVEEIEPVVEKAISGGAQLENPSSPSSGAGSHSWLIHSVTGSVLFSFWGKGMTKSQSEPDAAPPSKGHQATCCGPVPHHRLERPLNDCAQRMSAVLPVAQSRRSAARRTLCR